MGQANAGPIWAAGLMSGTSLDGVDGALVLTDGIEIADFGAVAFRGYEAGEVAVLRAGLGAWPGAAGVAEVAGVIEAAHIAVMAQLEGAGIVGFHGQTLAHDPRGRGTHQAGDGDRLVEALGLPVVWDFRSADVALGGEGAPLAPVFHHACARWIGAEAPVVFLNLGGVGNLTWADPRLAPEEEGALLAFDTGPANAPINDLVRAAGLGEFDRDGALALAGHVDRVALEAAMAHRFYDRMPPKSLDRDELADSLAQALALPLENAAATLVAVIAESVARGLTHCPQPPERVLVTGGGRRNPAIMAALTARLPAEVVPVEDVGLDGDMLEAQAFAYLAVRVARGMATSFPGTTGVAGQVGGGQISRPQASRIQTSPPQISGPQGDSA